MKHFPLVQTVTENRKLPRTAIRSLRNTCPDRALAQLIALHVPTAWRF